VFVISTTLTFRLLNRSPDALLS